MRGVTPAFLQHARTVGGDVRQMVEAVAVATNGNGTYQDAVKKLKADWDAADSLTGLTSLPSPNDGVQLAETSFTALDHSTVTAGQYATQLNKGAASFQCARLSLEDSKSAQVELLSLTARLNPAQGGAQQVAWWNCQVVAIGEHQNISPVGVGIAAALIPLGDPLVVPAVATEGDVVFDWSGKNPKLRPKHPPTFPGYTAPWGTLIPATPRIYVLLWGTKADGSVAANVGWACESVGSYTQNADILTLAALTQSAGPSGGGFPGVPDPLPGSSWWKVVVSTTQTPRLKVVYNTGTAATITFSGANKPDLGGVPAASPTLVEFSCKGEIPAGSSITYQVQADDATWLPVTDGQTTDELTAANSTHPITRRQTYSVRATLTPSATSDATPTLRELGPRAVSRTDLSDVAEVTGGEVTVDPLTLKSNLPQATLSALRDGDPDYRDAISALVSTTPLGALELRVYRGSRSLARGDWLLQRTFLVDDVTCPGASVELSLISPLALVRGQLPVYNPGTGLRIPLKYAGSSIAAAYADILDGQLGLPGRYRGPGPSDTTVVGKLIPPNAQAVVSSYALLRSALVRNLLDQQSWQTVQAKDELDNLAFLAGVALIESQGRLKCVPFCPGSIVTPSDTGTASAGGASTLTDGTKGWVTNQFAGGSVTITGGTGAGQTADVLSNTGTVLTISGTWTTNPTATSTYTVTGVPGFQLTPEGIVRSFEANELRWGRVSPGFAQRVPEVYVPWNWNVAAQRLEYEYRAFNGPALLNLGNARIDSVSILPTDLGQWITSDGVKQTSGGTVPTSSLARRVAVRHATLFGGGLLQWEFETTYEYPELEEGDLVAVPTAHFVANDPISSRPISGWLMAVGKICGTDLTGKRFKIWIRRWNDLSPANSLVVRQSFAAPRVALLSAYIDYAGVAKLSLLQCPDAKAVRIASSSSGVPSDATTRAAGVTTLDANGIAQNVTLMTCPAGGSVYAKVFAYENADGTGSESGAATLQVNLVSSSTSLNGQGSMPPFSSASGILTYTMGGGANGHMWIALSCAAQTLYRPDGTTVALAATSDTATYPRAVTPTLSQVAGGALGARTRWVRIGYVKGISPVPDATVYMVSPETSLAVGANNLLKVTSPPAVAGYDGYVVMVGSASNNERWNPGSGGTNFSTNFGTDWTEPLAGADVTTGTLYNAAMDTAITAMEKAASLTLYTYPYLDLLRNNRISWESPGASRTVAAASVQNGDGHMPLSVGGFAVTTPPAAGSGSASGPAAVNSGASSGTARFE